MLAASAMTGILDHPSHQNHQDASKEYAKMIESTRKEHWENWLLNASERDMWTANRYATDPPSDGGKSHIPSLNRVEPDGSLGHTRLNTEASAALATAFFPPSPHPHHPTCMLPGTR